MGRNKEFKSMTTGDLCSAGQLNVSKRRENIKGQLLQAGKWNCEKRNSRQSHRAAGEGAVGKQHRSNVETPQAVQMITMITMLTRMIRMMTCTHSRSSTEAMWKRLNDEDVDKDD